MRPYLYLALFLLFLLLPFAMRRAIVGRPVRLSGNARTLVIVTPHNQDIRREFAHAFNRWHQRRFGESVIVDYRTPGSSNDIRRLLESMYDAYRDRRTASLPQDMPVDLHVVFGGGDYEFNELKKRQVLQPVAFDRDFLDAVYPEHQLAGVNLLDTTRDVQGRLTPAWFGVCLSAFGIVYNPDLYQKLDLPDPRSWHDLTHPKLSGLVSLADPTHSGSAAVAYAMVLQRSMADAEAVFLRQHPELKTTPAAGLWANPAYHDAVAVGWKHGMSELLLIAANARYFSNSASQVPHDVGDGQAAAGMAIDFYGRVYQEHVGNHRCRVVLPRAATAITPDTVAILHGVKGHELVLARRFIEFCLSPEGQLLWILRPGEPHGPLERSLRRPPVRRDLYVNRRGWADDIDPFEEAGGFNQRKEFSALFTDTRPIWTAAWIDARDDLNEAYSAVLAVPDPVRRRSLIAKLADLPVTMADVENRRAQRTRMQKLNAVAEWAITDQIHWTICFQQHYRRVRDLARP